MEDIRKEFLVKLTIKKQDLEKGLRRLMVSQREYTELLSDDDLKDESDQAQRESLAASIYGLIERKSIELRDVNRLIEKILRDENFGFCEECDTKIPLERLLIVPETTLCVKCRSSQERFHLMRPTTTKGRTDWAGGRIYESDDESLMDDFEYELTDVELDLFPREIDNEPPTHESPQEAMKRP